MVEDPRPTSWSKRGPGIVSNSRLFRVGNLYVALRTFLSRFSFIGLSGLYFSLEHLSVSDATMLTFITPILLGFSGAIFLKEPVSLKEMFSGCRRRRSTCCGCSSRTASMQLHWRYFDCKATVSFW